VALKRLRECGTPLVIDDFHYLPKDLKGGVNNQTKREVLEAIFRFRAGKRYS
jgi:hypothetical protein